MYWHSVAESANLEKETRRKKGGYERSERYPLQFLLMWI
jgi:hypothetical protein